MKANVVYGIEDSDTNMTQSITQSGQDPTYNNISPANDNLPIPEGMEYSDDESPYWIPSDEERELLSQFNQLKIQNIPHKELE